MDRSGPRGPLFSPRQWRYERCNEAEGDRLVERLQRGNAILIQNTHQSRLAGKPFNCFRLLCPPEVLSNLARLRKKMNRRAKVMCGQHEREASHSRARVTARVYRI